MNDNDFRASTETNRRLLEEHGVRWRGGFDRLVKDTQLLEARKGRFLSFDETAYYITVGGVDDFKDRGIIK